MELLRFFVIKKYILLFHLYNVIMEFEMTWLYHFAIISIIKFWNHSISFLEKNKIKNYYTHCQILGEGSFGIGTCLTMRPHPRFAYTTGASLKMLLPSTAFSPNPNLAINSSRCTMKATSEVPAKAHTFPFFSNPKITTTNIPQNLASSKCFSSTNPVPILKANASRKEEVEGSGLSSDPPLVVVSFYKFADFPDHVDLRKPLKELCEQLVNLTFLLAYCL